MQSRVFLPILSAAALFAGAACANDAVYGHAKLAAPLAAPKTATLGGLAWKCEADACVATGNESRASWSAMYACKKVAASFGPLASYSLIGVALSGGDLTTCNKSAAAAGGAQTATQ